MIFTIILTLIALAALWQLVKVIFFTVLWLGSKLLLGLLTCWGRSSRRRLRRYAAAPTSFHFREGAIHNAMR
jgi:alpha-beta hydrolase superfamily lysophospholipase